MNCALFYTCILKHLKPVMDTERMIEWEFGGYFISRIVNGCNVLRQFETTFSDSLLHSQLDDAMLIKKTCWLLARTPFVLSLINLEMMTGKS